MKQHGDPFATLKRVFQFRSIRPHTEAEVDEEIEYHLGRTEADLVAGGMPGTAAHAEARRRFGDIARHRAALQRVSERRGRRERFLHALAAGLEAVRRGVRRLGTAPGVTFTVVVTLALGIGANATMFGIIDRLILSPPPGVSEPDRVMRVYVQRRFIDHLVTSMTVTYPDLRDLDAVAAFEDVAAFAGARVTVGEGADAERISGRRATPSFFRLLGVQPLQGRFYDDSEDVVGAADVAVLGYQYWRRRYGADPEVIGARIRLGGVEHEIVGVAPPGFNGVGLTRVDIWLPLRSPVGRMAASQWQESRGWYWLQPVVRLADGVSAEVAAAEATAVHRAARQASAEGGDRYDPEAKVVLGSLIAARGPRRSDESVVARWLAGVAAVVLLIACANVANILLASGSARRREIGIRMALGISTRRLVGELLCESVLLAALGGVAALVVTAWGSDILRSLLFPDIEWGALLADRRLLGFTAAVAMSTGVVAGLLPAVHAARLDVRSILAGGARDGGSRRSRLRTSMLVLQTSMSVVLLVGAGLFVRSLMQVRAIDLGFDEDTVVVDPEIDGTTLPDDQRSAFFERAARRLRALPVVSGVTSTAAAPFYSSLSMSVIAPDVPEPPTFSSGGPYVIPVGDDYFETMQVRILRGRGFTRADQEGAPLVAVMEQTMARAYWPGQDPLGKCLKVGGAGEPCSIVVGLAEDTARQELLPEENAQYYIPMAQHDQLPPPVLMVRVAPGQLEVARESIAREVRAAADGVRYVSVYPLRDLIDPSARSWRMGATMFSLFGLLALVIAAVGLYGVLAFNVAQRTHEMGVRAALGAGPRRVVALVVSEASRLVVGSIILGVVAAWVAVGRIEPLLYGVSSTDPVVFIAVVLLLLGVALAAALVPATRAARVDPVRALRVD